MRVLISSEALKPLTGPVARSLNFAKALAESGHGVIMICPGIDDLEEADGRLRIRQFRATDRPTRYLRMLSSVLSTTMEFDPDILQVTSYYASILPVLGRSLSVPVVSDYHASMRVMERTALLRLANAYAEIMTIESANATIVPTSILSEYILRRYGRHSTVVPNCINLDRFRPVQSKQAVCRELKIEEETRLVFFHGSPYPENITALRRLGQILAGIEQKGVRVLAVVAGDLPPVIDHLVRYLGYRDNLAPYICACDVAILPVDISEMGVRSRVVEYLACGIPVVTTRSGATGMEEAVRRGLILVGRNDKELLQLTGGLLSLSQADAAKVRSGAREFAEEHFSHTRAARQLEEVYRKVAGRSPG